MSDLISRQALIKAMEKKYDIAEATGMYPTGLSEAFIITEQIIKEQPTAYDVDKVLEMLEDCKCSEEDANREESIYMRNVHIQMCINVVKGAAKG